ncbi:MAG TPA: hypothetical protein VGI74_25480 [Streptosporangiaceae bacterium]
MTATGELEGAYRRLLRWYPPVYRGRHGEEILGVLMATAEPGQRQPGARESLDLLWSALKIRTRVTMRGDSQPWATAFAQIGMLLPVLMVVLKLTGYLERGGWYGFGTPADALVGAYGDPGRYVESFQLNAYWYAVDGNITQALTQGPGPALILAVLALAGWRRTAAGFAALVPLAYLGVSLGAGYTLLGGPNADVTLYAYGLEAVVLLAAPAAPRGWRALQWRPSALLFTAAVAGGVAINGGISPLLHIPFLQSAQAIVRAQGGIRRILSRLPSDTHHYYIPPHGFVGFIDRVFGLPANGWGNWLLSMGTLVAVIVVALVIMLVSSPASRRAVALLAVPFIPWAVIYLCSLINPPLTAPAGNVLAAAPLLLILLAAMVLPLMSGHPAGPDAPNRPAAPGNA